MLHRCALTVFAAAVALLGSHATRAATIFDNFGPADFYDVEDVDITGPARLAFRFAVSGGPDFDLDQVVIPLNSASAPTTTTLFLAADAGGAPGAVVASFPTVNVLNPAPGDIFTLTPTSPATLLAGASYWLVHAPPSGVEVGWGKHNAGAVVPGAFTTTGAPPWSPFDSAVAFRVEGTPIPEPATAWLLALGLLALGGAKRRRE